jgi:hypothetical protein
LPAGTHLILGGSVSGDHVAKIVGVRAVNIPRVEFDGGRALKVQGNRVARSPARILFAALASVNARIILGTSEGPNF